MDRRQDDMPAKQPRGRPKGTAKFEQDDRKLLAAFAELAIGSPGAKLAPFLAQRGYAGKDVRRAQQRWRSDKASFLREAQLRADASPAENLVELVTHFVETMSHLAVAVRPALSGIAKSLERARLRAAARAKLGLGPDLPIDLADGPAVERALREYEETIGVGHEPTELKQLPLDDLPLSLKLYAAAMMLHQASLQAAEAEGRDASAPSHDGPMTQEGKQ